MELRSHRQLDSIPWLLATRPYPPLASSHRLNSFHARVRFGPLCFAAGACPLPFDVLDGGCSSLSGEESSSSGAASSSSWVSAPAADGAGSERELSNTHLDIAASVVNSRLRNTKPSSCTLSGHGRLEKYSKITRAGECNP